MNFAVPEGWQTPERLDANTLYLTDGQTRLFIYRGDAAYVEQHWGIPAGVTDLDEAAEAVAGYVTDGEVVPYKLEQVRLVTRAEAEPLAGLIYLFAPKNDEWLIVSANVSPDQFETAQSEVLDPLIESLDIVGPLGEIIAPLPTMTAQSAVSATPMLTSNQMTATQMIWDVTVMAATYMTHTPTPVFSPTYAVAHNYGATATVIVQTAAALTKTSVDLPDLTGILPDDWRGPEPASANSVYFTDDTARLYIYHGDAAYFEDTWQIPAGKTSLYAAATAVTARVGGVLIEDTGEITPDTLAKTTAKIEVTGAQTSGAVWVIMRPEGWLIVSVSAPPEDLARYTEAAFEPVVEFLDKTE